MEAILQFLNLKAAAFAKGPKGMAQFTHIPAAIRHKVFQVLLGPLQHNVWPQTKRRVFSHLLLIKF